MVNLGKYLIFIFLVMIFTAGPSFAGDIKGKVVDSRTGEPVFGATVLIKELGKGTSTGLDGTYRLKNIEKGKYKLVCSYVGYSNDEQIITIGYGDALVVVNC